MRNELSIQPKQISPDLLVREDGYKNPVEKKCRPADPITDMEIVANICDNFKERGKFRDNLLFTLGCNCGLRCGEIISIKWGQLVEKDGTIKEETVLIEEKNSKKDKVTGEFVPGKIKTREIYINDTVKEAIALYANSLKNISLNDYVFKSEARTAAYYSAQRANGIGLRQDHITRQAVHKILRKTVNEILHYDIHASTHCMRKTFARFIWDNAPDQRSALAFLQKTLGHATPSSTLHYIGVTQEEIENVVLNLNLGRHEPNTSNIMKINFGNRATG